MPNERGGSEGPDYLLFLLNKTCPEHGYRGYTWCADYEGVIVEIISAIDVVATDECTEVASPFDFWWEEADGPLESSEAWEVASQSDKEMHWKLVDLRERLDDLGACGVFDEDDANLAEALFNELFADLRPGFEVMRLGRIETVLRTVWIPQARSGRSSLPDDESRLARLLSAGEFDAREPDHFGLARAFLAPHDGFELVSGREGDPTSSICGRLRRADFGEPATTARPLGGPDRADSLIRRPSPASRRA